MTKQPAPWQNAVKTLITSIDELLSALNLRHDQLPFSPHPQFPLRVSRSFVARMEKGNPHDPLLLQILPTNIENKLTPGYMTDPLAESNANPIPGLLHKYKHRVLITLTGACPIHCRFCFRRHYPYADNRITPENWHRILEYLKAQTDIREVIFSGGDPLMLPDHKLGLYLRDLESINSIKLIRFHTRFPVLIPERITSDFINILNNTRFKFILVYHINHPQELCDAISSGVTALRNNQVTVLNQSVLLKNINDKPEILKSLSEQLFDAGILPYYLHCLDPIQGTAHFDIDRSQAIMLQQSLIKQLPGYLVPRLVEEKAGYPAKSLISLNI